METEKGFNSAQRVLPPDVFDALELSAEAFGGVGRGLFWDCDGSPRCIHGLAMASVASDDTDVMFGARMWLFDANITVGVNDEAIDVTEDRIPFAEWCRRLNVVRGDTPTFDPANFPPKRTAKRPSPPRSKGRKND